MAGLSAARASVRGPRGVLGSISRKSPCIHRAGAEPRGSIGPDSEILCPISRMNMQYGRRSSAGKP